MKNFGAIIGSFTGFIIGLLLSVAIGLAVVPTTTTERSGLMVLSGANAAIFVAELENPYPTPPRITVSWEEDGI